MGKKARLMNFGTKALPVASVEERANSRRSYVCAPDLVARCRETAKGTGEHPDEDLSNDQLLDALRNRQAAVGPVQAAMRTPWLASWRACLLGSEKGLLGSQY